jgi:hypothetical protein
MRASSPSLEAIIISYSDLSNQIIRSCLSLPQRVDKRPQERKKYLKAMPKSCIPMWPIQHEPTSRNRDICARLKVGGDTMQQNWRVVDGKKRGLYFEVGKSGVTNCERGPPLAHPLQKFPMQPE